MKDYDCRGCAEEADDEIVKLKKQSNDFAKKAKQLICIKDQFPDLKRFTGENGTYYFSASINIKANKYKIYNPQKWNSNPIIVSPYFTESFGDIASDPPIFEIGEEIDGQPTLYRNWSKKLKEASISKK